MAWPSLSVSVGIGDLGLRIGSSEMKEVRWIYAILICLSMFGIWMCRLCFPVSHGYFGCLCPGCGLVVSMVGLLVDAVTCLWGLV